MTISIYWHLPYFLFVVQYIFPSPSIKLNIVTHKLLKASKTMTDIPPSLCGLSGRWATHVIFAVAAGANTHPPLYQQCPHYQLKGYPQPQSVIYGYNSSLMVSHLSTFTCCKGLVQQVTGLSWRPKQSLVVTIVKPQRDICSLFSKRLFLWQRFWSGWYKWIEMDVEQKQIMRLLLLLDVLGTLKH